MTWCACPHCNSATYAYSNDCDYCKKPLGDGSLPLYGIGGRPLESFICRNCAYINNPKDEICARCGAILLKNPNAK
jgi:RNA polymerase subunit RPABC4/transcription elongation factor Spt4